MLGKVTWLAIGIALGIGMERFWPEARASDDDVIYGTIVEEGFWADSIAVDWTNVVDATVSWSPLEADGVWLIRNVSDNDTVWTIGGRQVWPEDPRERSRCMQIENRLMYYERWANRLADSLATLEATR